MSAGQQESPRKVHGHQRNAPTQDSIKFANMGDKKQSDNRELSPDEKLGLGCLFVAMVLWWPFASCCVVCYCILIGAFESPFVVVAYIPIAFAGSMSLVWMDMSNTSDASFSWSYIKRTSSVFLKKSLPCLLAMMLVPAFASLWLNDIWKRQSDNRYFLVLAWSLAIGAAYAVLNYLIWRLLKHPILNPKHPKQTK
jgi:hypothetical protein